VRTGANTNRQNYIAQVLVSETAIQAQRETFHQTKALLRDLVARAGDPGSESFGLTMEDWSYLLGRLGHELQVNTGRLT
jgi:hypothetical protein